MKKPGRRRSWQVHAIVWLAVVFVWTASAVAPTRAMLPAIARVYRIAPIKPTDDWSPFVEKLQGVVRNSRPEVQIVPVSTLWRLEECDKQSNCDVVTIDKPDKRYIFKIKNGNQAHLQMTACSNCSADSSGDCTQSAMYSFVGFMMQHDKCHQDSSSSCPEYGCK